MNPDTLTALKSISDLWASAYEAARKAKEPFMAVANQCHQFYAGSGRFMWDDQFKNKYIGAGIGKAKFEVSMNKAFEFVTMFGPSLFWNYPQRSVTPLRPITFQPDVLGDPNDPNVQQMHQQMMAESTREWSIRSLTADMMERYLNYTPTEQTGTLAYHGQAAVLEALIKGRGLLWPETYRFPASQRTLTQLTWDTVDHFFIDADCRCPLLSTAKYIIRRHVNATWDVERRFNLPPGYLKNKGNLESTWSTLDNDFGKTMDRNRGEACDLIIWFEVFSKAGVGTRMKHRAAQGTAPYRATEAYHLALESTVGDYAYICFAKGVDHPLNCTPQLIESGSEDEIREAFAWPFPSYIDGKWPVAILDFHMVPNSSWPLAPLAPALGPLICINVLVSALVEQAWENRKTIVAYLKSAASTVEQALKTADSTCYLELADSMQKSISDCVQILQRPGMNRDLLEAIAAMTEIFEKNSNLTDFAYGASTTQSRSAADISAKQERVSVRPAKMAQDVKSWMAMGANLEKLLAAWSVKGEDLVPMFGTVGARLWDMYVSGQDPEIIARSMNATCDADDMARPNRERDFSNLSNLAGWLLPTLESYASVTGDTGPQNAFLKSLGDAMGQDTGDWMLGPWAPAPPSPEEMQLQQQMTQLEVQGKEADVAKGQAEAQKAAAELMESQSELEGGDVEHEAKVLQSGELFAQKMAQNELAFRQKMQQQAIMTGVIARSRLQQQAHSNQRKRSGVGAK